MVTSVVKYLNLIIETIGFRTFEVRTMNGYPSIYQQSGEYIPVNFDNYENCVYHRINGTMSETEDEDLGSIGGEEYIIQSWPMRLIAYFDKRIYSDESGIEEKVSQNLRNVLKQNINTLNETLGVDYIDIDISNIEIRPETVWSNEIEGEFKLPSNKALISIEYSISIGASNECLLSYGCDDEPIDIEAAIVAQYCSNSESTFMIKSYLSNDAAIQVSGDSLSRIFIDFLNYSLEDMQVVIQGAGLMGSLSTLSTSKKMITAWDSSTAKMTFKSAIPSDNQITIIGTTS